MIRIPQSVFEEMTAHAKGSYPDECCGALLGSVENPAEGPEVKSVASVIALTNINEERSVDRYEIDPLELLKAEKEARASGLAIVGYYHSHPDHPDEPSEFDRERAWPDYSYVIIAVENGENIKTKSWTFTEMDAPFFEEELEIF